MRLYDEILESRGGLLDQAMEGAITKFCQMLERAQCFLMADPIASICVEVCQSKPSSILSAIDMTRAPYPLTWIEWSPSARPPGNDNGKPTPRKVGALLMTNPEGSKGHFALAWSHGNIDPLREPVCLNPIGLIFDWDSTSTEPVFSQYARHLGIDSETFTARKRRDVLDGPIPGRWAKYNGLPGEKEAVLALEMRAELMPLEFCTKFMVRAGYVPGHPQYDSYCNDLAGELPFIESFLLLLNAKNSIVAQKRDDFTRLNKARAKSRKPPLKEFVTTTIKLNRVQSNRAGTGTDRAAARAHMVRGHFKIKYGNVWWWNPHTRGKGAPVRREYNVR